jgi:hypothetical protein
MKLKRESKIFRRLTVDSINEISYRLNNLNHATISGETDGSTNDKNHKLFATGNILSQKIKKTVPKELFGVPLEEIDDFYEMDYVYIF